MVRKQYHKAKNLVERRRFRLLLSATFLLLVLPAFFGKGLLSTILFVVCLSFLLIQSAIIARASKPHHAWLRYLIASIAIILFWLDPLGFKSEGLDMAKFLLLIIIFFAVLYYLFRYLRKAQEVNIDVLFVSVNIYMLLGIVFGSLAYLFNEIYTDAYQFPAYIVKPTFTNFIYYSFITMSTVGYGDITPKCEETQTLAYLTSVTGQLYVAIIVAFLVGKLLVKANKDKEK
jgi:voltage-gated potassium channel